MNSVIIGVQRSIVTFVSSSSTAPAIVSAKLRSLHSHRLQLYQAQKQPPAPRRIDDLVSGYFVYMAAIKLRHMSLGRVTAINSRQMSVERGAHLLQKIHEIILSVLERALTHSGKIEPSGVGDLLRSSLSDEIDILQIGTVLKSCLWAPDNKSYQIWTLFAQLRR